MTEHEQISVLYHQVFHYKLSPEELKKWTAGKNLSLNKSRTYQSSPLVLKSKLHKSVNQSKKELAQAAGNVLSHIPSVLFIGITGSLAMENAQADSDIDLLIITQANTLWITRIFSVLLLLISGYKLRTARNNDEKDKLCMNLWLDETALDLPHMTRSVYTAHELAQVVPLINKQETYERLLSQHTWIRNYWPNSLHKKLFNVKTNFLSSSTVLLNYINAVAYVCQRQYMKQKMTREQVSVSYAYFHPFDWGEKVLKDLKKRGVIDQKAIVE